MAVRDLTFAHAELAALGLRFAFISPSSLGYDGTGCVADRRSLIGELAAVSDSEAVSHTQQREALFIILEMSRSACLAEKNYTRVPAGCALRSPNNLPWFRVGFEYLAAAAG